MMPLQWLANNCDLLSNLTWVIVSLVGLGVAVRRRKSHPAAIRFAIPAFAVLLFRGLCFLGFFAHDKLIEQGVGWAAPAAMTLWIPYLTPAAYALGFALLTAAVFSGRSTHDS